MDEQNPQHDFARLDPELIIDSVESLGLHSDARIFALNSYENRVYQIGLDSSLEQPGLSDQGLAQSASRLIGKYYRPHRWSDAQILEEHEFTEALAQQEIPVVAPLRFNQHTLQHYQGFRFALYPQRGGRIAELDNPQHLQQIGRFLGRIHLAAGQQQFTHRPSISIEDYAMASADYLLGQQFIPNYLVDAYRSLSQDLIKLLQQRFAACPYEEIRLHGDCHAGNILWTDDGPHFVDFDDCRNGPAVQDLWMLLSGEAHEQQQQLNHVLDGYFDFAELAPAELQLVEPLRCLRQMHYAGWLARRWDDPSFPMNFPWFNSNQYWEQHILELREQYALLQDSPTLHV